MDLRRRVLQHRQELFNRVNERRAASYWPGYRNPPYVVTPHPQAAFSEEYTFNEIWKRIHDEGIAVMTKVEWLPPYEELNVNNLPWVEIEGGGTVPENPMLGVTVHQIDERLEYLMPYTQYRYENADWHVSLGFYWEFGPDIYDAGGLMEGIIDTLHNRIVVLQFKQESRDKGVWAEVDDWGRERTGNATILELDPDRDPIASNPFARAIKARSPRYCDRPWHVSL